MKILFLSHRYYPDIGGIETISEVLADAFHKDGNEIHVLTWTKEKGIKEFPFKIIRNPGLLTLYKEHSWADIVFENNPCIRLSWPCKILGTPNVISLQTWINRPDEKVIFHHRLKLLWVRSAKKIIACSDSVRKKCLESALVIGNPYNEKLFKRKESIPTTKDFIFLGRLVSDKGADMALEAFNQLLPINERTSTGKNPQTLTIAGDGPERKTLEKKVLELGLSERVIFTGALRGQELVNCLNMHRFILVPSRWEEPFGIVVLEGLACGCIPIVSDGGGLPDAAGKSGIVFKRNDIADLVNSMESIRSNPQREAQLRHEANKHLAAHTTAAVSKRYLSEIKGVLNKH